jgi:hypothetical protein
MNENILNALNEVFHYAKHVDEWVIIKKELLKCLNPQDRKLFSTRDPLTKKQNINEMEKELMALWSKMTKRPTIVKKDEKKSKQHSTTALNS